MQSMYAWTPCNTVNTTATVSKTVNFVMSEYNAMNFCKSGVIFIKYQVQTVSDLRNNRRHHVWNVSDGYLTQQHKKPDL